MLANEMASTAVPTMRDLSLARRRTPQSRLAVAPSALAKELLGLCRLHRNAARAVVFPAGLQASPAGWGHFGKISCFPKKIFRLPFLRQRAVTALVRPIRARTSLKPVPEHASFIVVGLHHFL